MYYLINKDLLMTLQSTQNNCSLSVCAPPVYMHAGGRNSFCLSLKKEQTILDVQLTIQWKSKGTRYPGCLQIIIALLVYGAWWPLTYYTNGQYVIQMLSQEDPVRFCLAHPESNDLKQATETNLNMNNNNTAEYCLLDITFQCNRIPRALNLRHMAGKPRWSQAFRVRIPWVHLYTQDVWQE